MGSALMAWLIGGGGIGVILGFADPLLKSSSTARDRFEAARILHAHRDRLTEDERRFADDLWNRVKPSDAFRVDLKRGV